MSSQKDTNPKLHILLLDQGRQALPFLKSLKKSGHHITIVCTSKISEGYFSLYADCRLIWPNYTENLKGYENALLTYLSVHKPDVTIPLGDISASVIANNRDQILQFTKVTIPPIEIFNLAPAKCFFCHIF